LLTLLAITGFAWFSIVAACSGLSRYGGANVTTPAGWRLLSLDHTVTIAVPPEARAQEVQPIDSIFGILHGGGYEIIYDYGRFGEQLATYEDQPGYTRRTLRIDGRAGTEIAFRPDAQPWGVVRILQVQDGANQLTIRVSCVDDDTCQLATDVFNSIRFTSG
jgi:hypothetical protein